MTRGWRLAIPLTTLITIHLATLFGGFLAPNSAIEQNRDLAWAPPTKLRFVDAEGRFHFRPFVYPLAPDTRNLSYVEDHSSPCHLRFFAEGEPYDLLGLFPANLHFLGADSPAKLFFLGTDSSGRDLFARAIVGGRISLFAGLLAASLALWLGSALGGLAGYLGGKTDGLIMRSLELFLALPWLYLLLAVRAFLPLTTSPSTSFLLLVTVIALIGWATPARLVRAAILSARENQFVAAARGLGTTHYRLFSRHILPEAFPIIRTQAAMLIPRYVLAEISLSFLGLGINQPTPSWGNMLADLQRFHVLANHPLMWIPAAPLLVVFYAYYRLQEKPSKTALAVS